MTRSNRFLAAIGVVLMAGFAFSMTGHRVPRLLYNPSTSAPIGWYLVDQNAEINVGDMVAAWLPEEAETLATDRQYLPSNTPVIKSVWAGPGTHYCIEEGWFKTDGRPPLRILPLDSQGRAMPVSPDRCRSVSAGKYLLVSEWIDNSFDSRYFGEVDGSLLLGRVRHLRFGRGDMGGSHAEQGWARGSGAEGKIKGVGSNPRLTPCLHITFYGANLHPLVPRFRNFAYYSKLYGGSISRLYTELHGTPPT